MAWNRCALVLMLAVLMAPFGSQAESVLEDAGRIELPGVKGRIDHLSADLPGKRLFVAALGNQTVEVVDIESLRVARSLTGFAEPQGVLVLTDRGRLFVTNAKARHASILDLKTLAAVDRIALPDDSDNIRHDGRRDRVWIGAGSGEEGALIEIDAANGRILQRIALAGHPESFQIEQKGSRIFVNVPTANVVQVVDRSTGKVAAEWPLPASANFAMALDEEGQHLFVVARSPSLLLTLDTRSGQVVDRIETAGDADDVFVDPKTRNVYVSGGEGFVFVYRKEGPDRYVLAEKIDTRKGARTSLFVDEWRLLFVAIPRRGDASAEIRMFRAR
jgi:DNA-binding beta-propeller fold protein YncE